MLSVEVADSLYAKADERWPKREQRPDSNDFCLGPLAAAIFQCERGYDNLAPESPGSPVRLIVIGPSGLFPPVVFYAIEVRSTGARARVIENLDFTSDDDYFDLIADDPDD